MGIAQIALDPPPSVKQANVEKKVLQTILASPYIPSQRCNAHTWKQHISKKGFPDQPFLKMIVTQMVTPLLMPLELCL